MSLSPSNFPPLPSAKKQSGYSHEFQKWTKDEIVGIISSMKEVLKPEDLPAGSQLILEQTNTQLEITRPYPKKVIPESEANSADSSTTAAAITNNDQSV